MTVSSPRHGSTQHGALRPTAPAPTCTSSATQRGLVTVPYQARNIPLELTSRAAPSAVICLLVWAVVVRRRRMRQRVLGPLASVPFNPSI